MPKEVALKELLLYILSNLVEHPESIVINELNRENTRVLEIKVHADDKGRLIGKGGQTIKAIRRVLNAAYTGQRRRVIVEILG